MQFFWVVTRCRLVGRCQILNETYCLFRAEDGECIFLQNFGTHPRVYTRHNRVTIENNMAILAAVITSNITYEHLVSDAEDQYRVSASVITQFTTGILHA
jgi:hypothetical protein